MCFVSDSVDFGCIVRIGIIYLLWYSDGQVKHCDENNGWKDIKMLWTNIQDKDNAEGTGSLQSWNFAFEKSSITNLIYSVKCVAVISNAGTFHCLC